MDSNKSFIFIIYHFIRSKINLKRLTFKGEFSIAKNSSLIGDIYYLKLKKSLKSKGIMSLPFLKGFFLIFLFDSALER